LEWFGACSWKPTPTSWAEVLTQIGCTTSTTAAGRIETSKRYLCTKQPLAATPPPAPTPLPVPASPVPQSEQPTDEAKGKRKKG